MFTSGLAALQANRGRRGTMRLQTPWRLRESAHAIKIRRQSYYVPQIWIGHLGVPERNGVCVSQRNAIHFENEAIEDKEDMLDIDNTVSRVWRGGSFGSPASYVRSASRYNIVPPDRSNSALFAGGGIYNLGTLSVLNHSTICGNFAPFGADLYNAGSFTKDASSTICVIFP
jgi:hypothetical protein